MKRSLRILVVVFAGSSCAHGNNLNGESGGNFAAGGSGGGASVTSVAQTTGAAGPTTVSNGAGPTTGVTTATTNPAVTATTAASGPSTTASATTGATTTSGGGGPGLLFSEYVEGSAYNKALEISNRGTAPASLSGCEIDHYVNGATTASPPSALDPVTLMPGQVYVICNTQFSQPSLCNKLDGKIDFTGNDVAALTCGGASVDVFGKIGDTNNWGTAPTSSYHATLRRKCTVKTGDTDPNDAFDPATEWNGFPVDTVSDLGQDNCP